MELTPIPKYSEDSFTEGRLPQNKKRIFQLDVSIAPHRMRGKKEWVKVFDYDDERTPRGSPCDLRITISFADDIEPRRQFEDEYRRMMQGIAANVAPANLWPLTREEAENTLNMVAEDLSAHRP